MIALNDFNQKIREYYQQAVDCARQADAQNDLKVKLRVQSSLTKLPDRRLPTRPLQGRTERHFLLAKLLLLQPADAEALPA